MTVSCSNKDSEFYNDVFVNSPNLVSVELVPDAMLKQTLYINANIPRYITEANQTNKLDIYKTTGGATRLYFSYELEKKIDANWSIVGIADNQLTTINGEAFSGSFIYGSSIYNPATKIYEYRVGIKSLAPGQYRLSFGYNSNSTTDVEFRSESVGNNLFLNLNSTYSALDGGGYYSFTIN
ncbi:hypothetical protein DB895_11505 [Flavobacterium psychrotolerans]|uniref:Uncharacterized protein n=2 Tax=Flavobacterium psychrotolerans TaxID=2169410 RepID=A0A2U1JGW5_9FLAO|nr:hypothetical protein DB895_11505 [Flavobacterium psychrotolerans]